MNFSGSGSRAPWKDSVLTTVTPERTLRIRSVRLLAWTLGTSIENLLSLAKNTSDFYRTFRREVKGKARDLVEATGPLKNVQRRVLDHILIRLAPSEVSFGGVKGRTIKDNAQVHARSKYIAKLDIKSFYPSVRSAWVYDFFYKLQDCSPDVAHILTALTTRNYALPLGTSTSPALADQIVRPVDVRIAAMAAKVELKYTRYVDDITLSGAFPLERLARTVVRLLNQNGFKVKRSKLVLYGPEDPSHERVITGAAVKHGQVVAPAAYVITLERQLRDAAQQSRHSVVEGDFLPKEHYRGMIAYVRWLDPVRGERLLRLYRKVKWRHLEWAVRQL